MRAVSQVSEMAQEFRGVLRARVFHGVFLPVARPYESSRPSAAAKCGASGGAQAAPDAMLADIPVPQRQGQALGAYRTGRADGDRGGCLLPGLACLGADREPLVGIEAGVSTAGVPDDPVPQGLIGERAIDQ